MRIHPLILALAATSLSFSATAQSSSKLNGKVIGTELSVDYATGQASTTINTAAHAFDGDFNTCFASYARSFTWAGMELSEPCVITRVGWAARNDDLGPGRMQLGVFQGANEPDFSDALPIYVIPEKGKIGEMMYADVACSRGFKYVRYVGPRDARCNVAELEFYGYPGQGDDKGLYQVTNLPTVVVNTPGMEWFHEDDKSYELNGSTITVIADGKIDVSAPGQIRGRGNASWTFPKKPFRIKFDKKQKVLGGPAKAKKWTMINNYGDKTLMRNKLGFEMGRMAGMPYTPACHFVDLVFNGEYEGTYQLCDQIEVNENRVNITEMKATDTQGEALTGGYLLEIDGYASQEPADEWFQSSHGYIIPVTIKSPDPGVSEQYNYIKSRFNKLLAALTGSNFADPEKGYRAYLDIESFLRYFMVEELVGNPDAWWSTYVTLDRGADRFVVGPMWDLDLGFDNDGRFYPISDHSSFLYKFGSSAGDMRSFVNRIITQDKEAKDRLAYIWSYAREYKGYDIETLSALIDQYQADLYQSQALNFKRWPIMNQIVHQNPTTRGSYEAEVSFLKSYLKQRFKKLDSLIGRVEVEGVEGVLADDTDAPVAIYNLQGVEMEGSLESLQPGIYVVRQGSTSRKVIVR